LCDVDLLLNLTKNQAIQEDEIHTNSMQTIELLCK